MSDGLGQFSYEELAAIQKGDFSQLSMEKLEALKQVAGGLPTQEQAPVQQRQYLYLYNRQRLLSV
jgi:hypothetical protein